MAIARESNVLSDEHSEESKEVMKYFVYFLKDSDNNLYIGRHGLSNPTTTDQLSSPGTRD